MGGLLSGSKTTTQKTESTSKPLEFQQNQLNTLFQGAGDAFKAQSGTPFYQGDLYAGMSQQGKDNLGAIQDYSTGQGQQTAGALTGLGNQLMGQAGSAIDTLGQVRAGYSQDPTQANLATAGAYAANPYLDGQIDAASRDVNRNLRENALPGLDAAAQSSGNMNSSRAGVAEGIARRGAADAIADISANFRGNAWSQGLGMAESSRLANLNGLAGTSAAYGNMAGQGASALQAGQASAYGNLNAATAADQAGQVDRQGEADAAYKAWQGQDTRQNDLLKRYQDVVAANNWGGTSTGTQTQKTPTGGVLGGILGLASGGLGIASGLGWNPLAGASK